MIGVTLFLALGICFVTSQTEFQVPMYKFPNTESYQYKNLYEVLISNFTVTWNESYTFCHTRYRATLITFEDSDLLSFAGEIMSESDFNLDSLWVGLTKDGDYFKWLSSNITVSNERLVECGNNTALYSPTDNIDCGAIIRRDHNNTCLIKLNCFTDRAFMCFKDVEKNNDGDEDGWIQIGSNSYKIFHSSLTHKDARKKCVDLDLTADLAVVINAEYIEKLSRYLLIQRPSLERGWIGAKWRNNHYYWQPANKIIPDKTDSKGYPPWRDKIIRTPRGCLLLDRHGSNVTYFVEAPCNRTYSYICYKGPTDPDPDGTECYTLGDYDYMVFYKEKSWYEASAICANSSSSGRLPVVKNKDLEHIVYIMKNAKYFLLHIWLGAYFKNGSWTWSYTNETLPSVERDGYPPWVVNRTYFPGVDRDNLCLNADRENSILPLFYGTICIYPQKFICQYDKGTMCQNGTTIPITDPITSTTTKTKTTTTRVQTTRTTTPPTTTTTRATTTKPTTTTTRATTTTTRAITTTPTTTTTRATTTTTTTPATTTTKTRKTTKNTPSEPYEETTSTTEWPERRRK